jgi:ABC-2 type transport system ATP-binding protein
MTRGDGRPALCAEGLVRDFGAVRALDHVTFEVPRGIVFGFLGPNGSGKTTAIRTFLGLIAPTAGRAEVLGLDVTRHGTEVRERCGALLEHPGLYERLTAEENLEFYGRAWRMSRAQRSARIKELLDRVDLYDRRTEPVGHWSRGMKQKLAVARAVLHAPELVFLDEPTSGLDPVSTAALREDLATLASREGVTVFLTTHNLSEAERLCAQVAVIREGRVLAVGSPATLRAGGREPRVTVRGRGLDDALGGRLTALRVVDEARLDPSGAMIVRLPDGGSAWPLVQALVSLGVEVEEVRRDDPTLEEAFLRMVKDGDGREAAGGPA